MTYNPSTKDPNCTCGYYEDTRMAEHKPECRIIKKEDYYYTTKVASGGVLNGNWGALFGCGPIVGII